MKGVKIENNSRLKEGARKKKIVPIKTETNVAGNLKVFLIALLIAFQLALIIFFHTRYALAVKGTMIFSVVISVLTCIYVLSTNKNGLSKAVWILFILVCFTFGYVIFWLSDARILFGKAKKRYKAVYESDVKAKGKGDKKQFSCTAVEQISSFLYSTGKFKTYDNCSQKYFPSGEEFWQDALEKMKVAKKFIFIEFFIISNGVLFDRVFDLLKQKVAEGVTVRIIYDDLGSKKTFSNKSKLALKNAGVEVKPFNRLVPIFSVALNYRDHRKIIDIDGKFAFTGGVNLADEYTNEKRMNGYWKDAGLRIEGSAVDAFTLFFLRQWEVLTKRKEDYSQYLGFYDCHENSSTVIPYADGLEYEHPIARGVFENMITSANEYLYIMTPYFIVDDGITSLLTNKALSGVDVRLILPSVPDKKFVYNVSRSNAEKLIDYGVKVYTVKGSFVHSKLLLTEDAVVIGSVNMDLRSFYQQFETAVYTDDKGVKADVLADFNTSFSHSEQITYKDKWSRNIFYRIFVGLIQVFAPFM